MKGGVAMMTAAFLRAHAEGTSLPGDVILCIVPDEEMDGIYGARFLVEEHPGLFAGVRYAIGEFGGYPIYVGGRKFYTITVGEKQTCSLRATVRGPGGHASVPTRGGAAARLGEMLTALDRHRLPVHITPPVRLMIETIARELSPPEAAALLSLLDPAMTDAVLDSLDPMLGRGLEALLRHTVNATVFHGGSQLNVIPSEIVVDMDSRLLPGFAPEDMLRELQAIIGGAIDMQVMVYDPGPVEADMGLFGTLADILREADPAGIPIPYILSGVTDGRFFSRLGIQTYGFLPIDLPDGLDIWSTIHAADERIPVEALDFGAQAIFHALQRFS